MIATPAAVGRDLSASVVTDQPGSSARSGGPPPPASESPTCSSDGAAVAGAARARHATTAARAARRIPARLLRSAAMRPSLPAVTVAVLLAAPVAAQAP